MARHKYKWRIAGFIFKALCTLIIAAIVILLLWRMIDNNNDPKDMDTVIPNSLLVDAYEKKGDSLNTYYQEQTRYTRGENNYGYFAITQSLIIDDIDQIQFVFRYNNSTLKYTKEDYSLDSIPSRDAEVYDVTVTVMYDLTPDDTTDNDGKTAEAVRYERIFPSQMLSAKKTLYNYRKFVFDGIKIDDSVIAVYADFYYVGDIDYDEKPYGSLLIYHYEEENISRKLTKNDVKAIEAWKED
ncbi:MAG: hypothetical protein J6L83_03610 [Clostridia bacterium]|nr:hypothetical protein [Clostridia bacterium]